MKSGLEDRNNNGARTATATSLLVSMKSGLEDRNNEGCARSWNPDRGTCLNEVRPGRPEQCT